MLDRNLANIRCYPVNQTVGVGVGPSVFGNFIYNKAIQHFKTGEIKIFGFVQHEGRNSIVESAAKVSEPRMPFLNIMAVDDVVVFSF